jgi:ComF family protein
MRLNLFPFKKFLDLLIPRRCIKCGTIVENYEGLCPSCWPLISFITKPICICCGLPFEFDIDEDALCGGCSHSPPYFVKARSAFIYNEDSKDLILRFKHTDNLNLATVFGQWMAPLYNEEKTPICIPVPLHWTRLFTRTFNQAALLAIEVSKNNKWEYAPTLLYRNKRTRVQGHDSKEKRIKNVEGVFSVYKNKSQKIKGRSVVLVDDVYTTGATLNACSKALLKAGAKEVHAITVGRVIKSRHLEL